MCIFDYELLSLEIGNLGQEKWQCGEDLDLNPTRVFLEMKMSVNAQNERFQLGRLEFFINSMCQKQTLEFFYQICQKVFGSLFNCH